MRYLLMSSLAALLFAAQDDGSMAERKRFGALRQRLSDPDKKIRLDAVSQVATIAEELKTSVTSVVRLLKDVDPAVRVMASEALINMGALAKDQVPRVRKILADEKDDDMRARLLMVLGAIAPHSNEALSDIAAHLTHKNRKVRQYAIAAVCVFGPYAKSTVPTLIDILQQPDKFDPAKEGSLHELAIRALGEIGPDAQAGVDPLLVVFKSADPVLRGLAAHALAKVAPQDKRLVPLFVAAFDKKTDKRVRYRAISALGFMGSHAKDAVPDLIRLVQKCDIEDPEEASVSRADAVLALGQIGTKEALDAVRQALKDDDPEVRRQAKWVFEVLLKGR